MLNKHYIRLEWLDRELVEVIDAANKADERLGYLVVNLPKTGAEQIQTMARALSYILVSPQEFYDTLESLKECFWQLPVTSMEEYDYDVRIPLKRKIDTTKLVSIDNLCLSNEKCVGEPVLTNRLVNVRLLHPYEDVLEVLPKHLPIEDNERFSEAVASVSRTANKVYRFLEFCGMVRHFRK